MGKEVGIFRFVRAVAVAGAVVVLSGCVGGGGEPSLSPMVLASASVEAPSPSPSLTHEEQMLALIPEAAKGDDLLAAEAMAKFFISVFPDLYRGEGKDLWAFMSEPGCEFCTSGLETAERYLAEGAVLEGGEFTIPTQLAETVIDIESGDAFVGLLILESQGRYVKPSGEVVAEREGGQIGFTLRLVHNGALWRVAGVAYEIR